MNVINGIKSGSQIITEQLFKKQNLERSVIKNTNICAVSQPWL